MSGSDDLTVLLAAALVLTGSVKALGSTSAARHPAYEYAARTAGALSFVFLVAALFAYLTKPL